MSIKAPLHSKQWRNLSKKYMNGTKSIIVKKIHRKKEKRKHLPVISNIHNQFLWSSHCGLKRTMIAARWRNFKAVIIKNKQSCLVSLASQRDKTKQHDSSHQHCGGSDEG